MKFKIIFSLILVAALGVMAYFAYPIVKGRYFEDKNTIENEKQETEETSGDYTISDKDLIVENNKIENAVEENAAAGEEIKEETDETGISANITAEDCDNECENFKNNASDLKYCQNICDISPIKDTENCESKSGADKDYCFKNQAVAKIDLNICESISDSKIKSSCRSRVTEDMLENQL